MKNENTFRVTEDRRVFLNGVEIERVFGFSINADGGKDPQVILRVAVDRIVIDGYTNCLAGCHIKEERYED